MSKLLFSVCTAAALLTAARPTVPAPPPASQAGESLPLPSDHWAYGALDRIEASGRFVFSYLHETPPTWMRDQFAERFLPLWHKIERDVQVGTPLDRERGATLVRFADWLAPELSRRGLDASEVKALVARTKISRAFPDLSQKNWVSPAVERTRIGGILFGYPGGTFLAPRQTTRDKATIGAKPYLGWSSWSLEATKYPGYGGQDWLTAQHIKEQSDILAAKLQKHGYTYINVDAGWRGGWDANGLPTVNATTFPGGMKDVADYVHAKGQKFGIYYVPGIDDDLLALNPPIKGTNKRIKDIVHTPRRIANGWGGGNAIDFSKPGAQEYIQSIADQFATWGVDFLKFDGVTPGSDQNNSAIDARPDVAAWGKALKKVSRPIWLTVSWHIDMRHNAFWRQHANALRTGSDVESYDDKLTHWGQISLRFDAARDFAHLAGRGKGWNDLDALLVGNGEMSDLTPDERRAAMTLWAIACSPIYSGDDLTKLDPLGLELLTNDEVIAVQQSGNVARLLGDGYGDNKAQVWVAKNDDGSHTVALFNRDDKPQTVTALWKDLGLKSVATVRDLWSHQDLRPQDTGFSAALPPHGCRLLKITPMATTSR